KSHSSPLCSHPRKSLRATNVLTLPALGDSDLAEVLKQLLPLIKSGESETGSDSSELSMDDLLVLLVYVYSLAQEVCPSGAEEDERVEKMEKELIGALTLRLTQETKLSPLLQDITGMNPIHCNTSQLGPEALVA
ncbi:putative protein similar to vertebrate sec1 family domain containing 2 SCFD2, partial [Triplophysa rosa]